MARGDGASWMQHLPMVLLGFRSAIREDCGRSPADLVLGTSLRLPGQLLPDPPTLVSLPTDDFVRDLHRSCLLYTSPSPRDLSTSRMPSSA